jgi:hypothetical protein
MLLAKTIMRGDADANEDDNGENSQQSNGIVSISNSLVANTGGEMASCMAGLTHEEIIKKLLSSSFRVPIPGYKGIIV